MKRMMLLVDRKIRNTWYSFLLFFTFLMCFAFFLFPSSSSAQITGLWKTIDDQDGREIAIIEIYEKDNKLFAKVIQLLPAAKRTICERCSGNLKNKPITGMILIQSLTKTSSGGEKGKILDPGSGRTYSCSIELVNQDKLKLRGYLGIPSIGRTQYWYRIPS